MFTSWPKSTTAELPQEIENNSEICAAAVKDVESRSAIPEHLLSAITLTESGRWNAQREANVAWPWTVSNGDAGRFFETKAEAVAEVEILLTAGVKNIDVGCMQINLRAHPAAFETLAKSFDPERNVAYGSGYLKRMFNSTGDWLSAAGAYHSTTPALNARYRAKVQGYWNEIRGLPNPALVDAADYMTKQPTQIDHARTEILNEAFRRRRTKQFSLNEQANRRAVFSAFRQGQIKMWRQQKDVGLKLSTLAGMRRAELAQRQRRKYVGPSPTVKREQLAGKRRLQLDDWRRRVVNAAMIDTN